jgi:hypothetical protein
MKIDFLTKAFLGNPLTDWLISLGIIAITLIFNGLIAKLAWSSTFSHLFLLKNHLYPSCSLTLNTLANN